MKYRIKQVDDVYYIEYTKSWWLNWYYVKERDLDVMEYYPIQFKSYEEARKRIDKIKAKDEANPIIKYHKA